MTVIDNSKLNAEKGINSVLIGLIANIILVAAKLFAGVIGNSYALIADGIESAADVIVSTIVVFGIRYSRKPADEKHPYGHGKFEPLTASFAALILLAAAIVIAVESIHEIKTPHHGPAPFTLIVLLTAVIIKELLFRFVSKVGEQVGSIAVKVDAGHHRSDALTSAAAFIGISIALIGGPGYESADDFAALIAAGIIAMNAIYLLRPTLSELLDAAPDESYATRVRAVAAQVEGVLGTHKCYVRKLGFDYYVDLDVLCDPNLTIREGHEIAHNVGDAVTKEIPEMVRVLVHVEPIDDYGRRSKDAFGV